MNSKCGNALRRIITIIIMIIINNDNNKFEKNAENAEMEEREKRRGVVLFHLFLLASYFDDVSIFGRRHCPPTLDRWRPVSDIT